MALMFVTPHDLEGACRDCGTSIKTLSEETGIPEQELREFAAGRLALNANDRFAILETLEDTAPQSIKRRSDSSSIFAFRTLMAELREEHRKA